MHPTKFPAHRGKWPQTENHSIPIWIRIDIRFLSNKMISTKSCMIIYSSENWVYDVHAWHIVRRMANRHTIYVPELNIKCFPHATSTTPSNWYGRWPTEARRGGKANIEFNSFRSLLDSRIIGFNVDRCGCLAESNWIYRIYDAFTYSIRNMRVSSDWPPGRCWNV